MEVHIGQRRAVLAEDGLDEVGVDNVVSPSTHWAPYGVAARRGDSIDRWLLELVWELAAAALVHTRAAEEERRREIRPAYSVGAVR